MDGQTEHITVITRAYNRLEYTIRCINSVRDNTIYSNYTHLIVDNASSDGTREWLQWVKKFIPDWFPNMTPLCLSRNEGDWGGLIVGFKTIPKIVSTNCAYVVQLDNDIEVELCWLVNMVKILKSIPEKILQLKRVGVWSVVTPAKLRDVGVYHVGLVKRPVGCFMLRYSDFKEALLHIDNKSLRYGKTQLSHYLKGTAKVVDLKCHMMGGLKGTSYINYEKYPPGSY